jgi:hypothetical protein
MIAEHKYNYPEARLAFSDYMRAVHVDGFVTEPSSFFVVDALHKLGWKKRTPILSPHYVTKAESKEFPGEVFFYGTPEAYVRSAEKLFRWEGRISAVANYDRVSGIIWSAVKPLRHHNLIQYMFEYGVSPIQRQEAEQGFMDAFGRFLNREEALDVAKRYDLFKPVPPGMPKHVHCTELFSEDLWSNEHASVTYTFPLAEHAAADSRGK